jgi:DNA-binding NtrC family response regulator
VSGAVAKPVVLVVDDEPAIRLLCKVNLELAGYDVREASSLTDARAALSEEVAVVLLDMHVGNERSNELLAELRERGLPVAVVTGSADLDQLRGSADAVLAKPFTIDDLESVVAELAGRPSVG